MSNLANPTSSATPDFAAKPLVALSDAEWRIVSEILRSHLPNRQVWAYGSRARRDRVKPFSDLDLAVEGDALSSVQRMQIEEAFDESLLPFRVDVVEAASLNAEFRKRIEADKVILARGSVKPHKN